MNQDEEFKQQIQANDAGIAMSELNDTNRKLRLELHTLRFKESQEERFVWWILNVYARNVSDLLQIIKDGVPSNRQIEFSRITDRLSEYTEHIYDGTYLDIEISAENKTVPENNPTYAEHSNNDCPKTQNVCSWIQEDDPEINLWRTSCHNAFYLDADKPSDNHMKYCCYCGKKIKEDE